MLDKIRQFTILTKAASAFMKLLIMGMVVILLVWQLTGHKTNVTEQGVGSSSVFNMVDALNTVPVNVDISNNVDKFEVYKMPEFALSLPDKDELSYEKMQQIGYLLGFTSKAKVMNFGEQVAYQEGARMIMFNPQMGQFDFTTAFNLLGGTTLTKVKPTEEKAQEIVTSFLSKAAIPTTFFDLDNLIFEPMYLDKLGTLTPATLTEGTLLKVTIPYQASTVRIILPVESYAVIDGDGAIRLMTLFVPNITQMDKTYTLINWGDAKEMAKSGQGAVIRTPNSSKSGSTIEKSYAAYYINQREFYALDKRRVLQPIYVFEGNSGMVAVAAERK